MAAATRKDWDKENRRGMKAFQEHRFLEAEEILTDALKTAESFGENDPVLPRALTNLGLVLHTAGRPGEAEPLYRRALEIVRQPGKAEDPDEGATHAVAKEEIREEVAVAAGNLAMVLRDLGRYADSEPLMLEALQIQERAWGPDDGRLAGTLDRLAGIYRAWDRPEQAEALLKRSLGLRERDGSAPAVYEGLDALADLYLGWGKYSAAEALYIRLLKLAEHAHGPESLEAATVLTALGRVHLALGKAAKAEPFSKKALAIREKALGPHHPEVAGSLNNLAYVCQTLGKFAAAEPMYKRSLALVEQALVPDHPNVAVCLENYASVLLKLRKKTEAAKLEERAKAIRAKQPTA